MKKEMQKLLTYVIDVYFFLIEKHKFNYKNLLNQRVNKILDLLQSSLLSKNLPLLISIGNIKYPIFSAESKNWD